MQIRDFFRKSVLLVGGIALFGADISAHAFGYTNVDLVAGFRRPGAASDLVVDLGPASYYESLPARTVVTTVVQSSQLTAALVSLDNVSWSVGAAMRGNTNYPQYPLQTIWATSPRLDISTPGKVWNRKGQFTQGTVAGQIDAIGAGAVTYGSTQPAGTNNTSTGIVISSTDQYSYTTLMTTAGDYGGTFQGVAENTTPFGFTLAGSLSRSVLYKMLPDSSGTGAIPGDVIGFFDFKSDGTLTFTAGPPPEPVAISSIQQTGSMNTIYFPTLNQGYYRLRYTDVLIPGIDTWATNGTVVIGDGSSHFIQDTPVSTSRFYSVESF